jgi:hypothetical protein
MLVGRGLADASSPRHFPQSEVPALVLLEHSHCGVYDRSAQVTMVIGARWGGLHFRFTKLSLKTYVDIAYFRAYVNPRKLTLTTLEWRP